MNSFFWPARRFSFRPWVDALHDGIADVEYGVTLSAGAGYYFVKTTNTVLSGEVGPGYVFEKLGSNERSYATLRVGEKFTQELSSHARLWQSAEFLPQVDDFDCPSWTAVEIIFREWVPNRLFVAGSWRRSG